MKLSPHDILQLLGFDIPTEGVEINGNDAFLNTSLLRLVGATINSVDTMRQRKQ